MPRTHLISTASNAVAVQAKEGLRWPRYALLLASAWLGGCATLAEYVETPRIALAEIAIVDVSLASQQFTLGLDITNTNPFPLPLASLDYAVELAGQRFATGSSTQSLLVGANATERVALTIDTDLATSALTLARLFIGGTPESLAYRLTGNVGLDLPQADKLLAYESAGEVALTRLPQ
ncbi:MAG: LEA type 2 family protein [Pseudomonadota bacterium]